MRPDSGAGCPDARAQVDVWKCSFSHILRPILWYQIMELLGNLNSKGWAFMAEIQGLKNTFKHLG